MTDEELCASLRMIHEWKVGNAAADRIEALVKEKDQWIEHTKNAVWSDSEELKLANARAERLEAALRLLHDNVVLAFPTLADLGPVANARAALKGADHE